MVGLKAISGFTTIDNGKRQTQIYTRQPVDLLIGHLRITNGHLLKQRRDHAKCGINTKCIKVRVRLFSCIYQQELPVIARQIADDEFMRSSRMFRIMFFSNGIGFFLVLLPGPVVVPAHIFLLFSNIHNNITHYKIQGIWLSRTTKKISIK